MAAWTESDRARIRSRLGFGAIFLQAYPRLESAMTAVLAVADGGTRPDSSTQTMIQGWLANLDTVDAQLLKSFSRMGALKVDEIEIDFARAAPALKSEGRRLVGYIADALDTAPVRDVFSAPKVGESGDFNVGQRLGPY